MNGRPISPHQRRTAGVVGILATALAVIMSLYHLLTAYFGMPIAELHRSLHVAFVLAVAGMTIFTRAAKVHGAGLQGVLVDGLGAAIIAAGVVAALYVSVNADDIQNRLFYVFELPLHEKVLAFALLAGLSEAARRSVGLAIVILMWTFIAYAFLGHLLPEPFGHRGFSTSRILEQIYITKDGIWSGPIGISASFMIIFVLFGSLMAATGIGGVLTGGSIRITRGWVGGPAKASVLSSALMSMLSGNAASNVATTGVVTIPTMERAGYRKEFASGVEAVASSGGQITPPIMGAAAFLLVEFVGVPYSTIMAAAVLPAALYFIGLFAMVHFEAKRLSLGRWNEVPKGSSKPLIFPSFIIVASLGTILTLLLRGYTPTLAGLWGIIILTAFTSLRQLFARGPLLGPLIEGLTNGARMITPVAIACAIGGIIAGITTMTGLGVKLSQLVIIVANGQLILALCMTLVIAVIMGMGLPSSSAYIILAALLAPSLVNLGAPVLAAHMFILFCGVSSTITPPVALASYTAAAISGADPWRTSLIGFRLGLSIYIIPFMFVFTPGLLMEGDTSTILVNFATATVGVLALSAAIIGYALGPLNVLHRILNLAGAMLLIEGTIATDIGGFAILSINLVSQIQSIRKKATNT